MRILVLLVALAAVPAATLAQVATDGSLGPAGPVLGGVLPDGRFANYRIDESLGQRAGANLFHSFETFGVPARAIAAFTADLPTERVLARVTGGATSVISGRLASAIPGADLYLMNPSGVVFSGGSSLEVQGSFHLSTADTLRLADGTSFSAVPSAGEVLSSSAPAAWGFLSDARAPVTIRACAPCGVPAGETLSVVAGDIQVRGQGLIDAQLSAPGGQILLAARASAGEVPVGVVTLDARGAEPGSLGSVRVGPNATLVVSEPSTASGERGRIAIRAGSLVLDRSGLFAESSLDASAGGRDIDFEATDGIEISNFSIVRSVASGAATGGAVRLSAASIQISGNTLVDARGFQSARAGSIELDAESISLSSAALVGSSVIDSAESGSIRVRTGRLELTEGAQLSSTTSGAGRAGDIDIAAEQSVRLAGTALTGPSGVFSRSGLDPTTIATGSGGNVTIASPEIVVEDGAEISARSFGDGDAGSVRLLATERVIIAGQGDARSRVAADAMRGEGGDVVIDTPELSVLNGGEISVSTLDTGDAGSVRIAADRVYVGGGGAVLDPAGIFAQSNDLVNATEAGNAGDIEIRVSRLLELRDGGIISASTRGAGEAGDVRILGAKRVSVADGEISARSDASGRAGAVLLDDIGALSVGGLGRITTLTRESAPGGQVRIRASREVTVSDGGEISARSDGFGDAGSISIFAGQQLTLRDGGRITTQAETAFGGNIDLRARHLLYVQDAEITTSVDQGAGDGGNITIDPEFVVLNGGTIAARANAGNGGNILIRTDHFVADATSSVDASSALGIDGQIEITSPETDLTGELARLEGEYLDASSQLARACAARSVERGTFAVRGGAPASAPDAPLAALDHTAAAPEGCPEP